MTPKQYRQANGATYPVIVVILGYFILTLLAFVFISGGNARTWIQLIVAILAVVISTVMFIAKRDTKICGVTLMASSAAAYAVICIFNSTPGTYVYSIPILLAAMAYSNARMVALGNVVVLVSNIVRILINWSDDSATQTAASIKEAAALQEESNRKMVLVAENIMKHFEEAMGLVDGLKKCIDTNNFAMTNIAESTVNTAESVQNQAQMCGDIRAEINVTETKIEEIASASHRTIDTLQEGNSEITKLKQQAENVAQISNETVKVIEKLTEQVNDVQGFVGTILNISNQTNLLALNASIEAARAEEIRQLSEQTKDASNHITQIIGELNEGTKQANVSIEESAQSVREQNNMIQNTQKRFEDINREMQSLSQNIQETEESMSVIVESTGTITDNISQLSASSEEVAAASSEGLKTSENAVDNMNKCKTILESICLLAQDLKDQAQEKG